MRLLVLAIALLSPVGTMAGQGRPARPTVRVQLSAPDASAADSSTARAALERGLQSDSLVELLHRPPQATPASRRTEFMVAVVVLREGDTVRINTRTFNTESSNIAVRTSTISAAATLGDSATAVGRRIARALAVSRP